jgi:hypothetical protein
LADDQLAHDHAVAECHHPGVGLQAGVDDEARHEPGVEREAAGDPADGAGRAERVTDHRLRRVDEDKVRAPLEQAADRFDELVIPLTHDQLAVTLGVRRAGITAALSTLETMGAIAKTRGAIEIADRSTLEHATCECYHIITEEYERMLELAR